MSLFVINRFVPDSPSQEAKKDKQAALILENINKQALERKQKRAETPKSNKKKRKRDPSPDSSSDSSSAESENKNDKKSKEISSPQSTKKLKNQIKAEKIKTNLDDTLGDDEKTPSKDKRKKKNKKRKSLDKIDTSERHEIDEDTDQKVDKQKKEKTKIDEDVYKDEVTDKPEEPMEDTYDEENDDEEPKDDSNNVESDVEGPHEVGGFTVLGSFEQKKVQKVKRVLPNWLAAPSVINADITNNRTALSDLGIDDDIVSILKDNGIVDYFPVQAQVIPAVLESIKPSFYTGLVGYRPRDICCSSPTGSGKTLAFALPIIQALRTRVVCQVRALVVLPVRDLAVQVFKVFQTYSKGTKLKVGLLVGQKAFSSEQQSIVKKSLQGYQSLLDIIVATPGRLVDHIMKTPGFSLRHLRFLVIDEADRMMEQIKHDWLLQVETSIEKELNDNQVFHAPLTVQSVNRGYLPPQKLLFSATLSQNPEKLQQLKLFQPKLFTSVVETKIKVAKDEAIDMDTSEVQEKVESEEDTMAVVDFVGKYTTPEGLIEHFVECSSGERPLLVLHIIKNLGYKHVLCFTNTVESTHRLKLLLSLVSGITVQEFSSNLPAVARNRILRQFESGSIDLLVCSDAMARGMDVEHVNCVISYENPPYVKTYIHRVGRTARAGKEGTAITLLERKQIRHFKRMLEGAGKTEVKEMKVERQELEELVPDYEAALEKLPEIIMDEKARKGPHAKKGTPKRQKTPSKQIETPPSDEESN